MDRELTGNVGGQLADLLRIPRESITKIAVTGDNKAVLVEATLSLTPEQTQEVTRMVGG